MKDHQGEEGFVEFRDPDAREIAESAHWQFFEQRMRMRRSMRHFSSDPVPISLVRKAVELATTAPSGANKQPWTFCIVGEAGLKRQIREAAEAEEYKNYHGRMSEDWLEDLRPFGTDHHKAFLEDAPYLIAIFKQLYGESNAGSGGRQKHYYVNESLGIATGILISALQMCGLCSLTHTPSPMNFLEKILERPENERAYLLIPTGWPHPSAKVPNIGKKPVHKMVYEYL